MTYLLKQVSQYVNITAVHANMNHFVTVVIAMKTGAIAGAVIPRRVCGKLLGIPDIMNDLVASSALICNCGTAISVREPSQPAAAGRGICGLRLPEF
jgi:hypothetical protein